MAVRMEREFGIPYVSLHTVFSVEGIDRAYEEIANMFGFVWKDEFTEERKKALESEQAASERLWGLKYVCSLGVSMPLALATYLVGFGMEPLLIHMEEFYPEDKMHSKALLALGQNPAVCRMVDAESDMTVIKNLNPDICFGNLPPWNKTVLNVENMMKLYGVIGYDLTIKILSQTFNVLDKDGINGKGEKIYGTA